MSFRRWWINNTVVHPYKGILYGSKKKRATEPGEDMEEPGTRMTKWGRNIIDAPCFLFSSSSVWHLLTSSSLLVYMNIFLYIAVCRHVDVGLSLVPLCSLRPYHVPSASLPGASSEVTSTCRQTWQVWLFLQPWATFGWETSDFPLWALGGTISINEFHFRNWITY